MKQTPGSPEGEFVISSGGMQRKISFRTYPQHSWSYGSNYFTMPIGADRKVMAQIKVQATGNIKAFVQIVGYTAVAEESKSDTKTVLFCKRQQIKVYG